MDEGLSEEILRLRGELSAATRVLSVALTVLSFGDTDTIAAIRKDIEESSIDITAGGITLDRHWREGVQRFKDRLLQTLPSDVA